METDQKFWVVWNPAAGFPLVKHPYLHEARAEAERLAARHVGHIFYVLRCVGKATTTHVTYEEVE